MTQLATPSAPTDRNIDELYLRVANTSQVLRLASRKCTIGTDPRCTLRLRGSGHGLHAVHCLVLRGDQQTIVRRWSPETRLNGRDFVDAPLQPGDTLKCGPIELEVVSPSLLDRGRAELAPNAGGSPDPSTASGDAANEELRLSLERQLAAERSELSAAREELEQRRRAWEIERTRWEAEHEAARTALDAARNELAARHTTVGGQEATHNAARLAWATERNLSADHIAAQFVELQRQWANLRQAQADLERTRRQSAEAFAQQEVEWRKQLDAGLEQVAAAAADRRELAAERTGWQTLRDAERREVEQGRAELERRQAEIAAERTAWEQERAVAVTEQTAALSEQTALAARLAREHAELDAARREVDSLLAEVDAAKRTHAAQVAAWEAERRRESDAAAEQTTELERRENELLARERELCQCESTLEQRANDTEQRANAIERRANAIEQRANDIEQRERQLVERERSLEDAEASRAPSADDRVSISGGDGGKPPVGEEPLLERLRRQVLGIVDEPPAAVASSEVAADEPANEIVAEGETASDEESTDRRRQSRGDDGHEEPSIDEYMAQLMNRLRPGATYEPAKQRAAEAPGPSLASRPSSPPQSTPAAGRDLPPPRRNASLTESVTDLSAMRELANLSTRAALESHEKRRQLSSKRGQLAIGASVFVGGLAIAGVFGGDSTLALLLGVLMAGGGVVWGVRHGIGIPRAKALAMSYLQAAQRRLRALRRRSSGESGRPEAPTRFPSATHEAAGQGELPCSELTAVEQAVTEESTTAIAVGADAGAAELLDNNTD